LNVCGNLQHFFGNFSALLAHIFPMSNRSTLRPPRVLECMLENSC
jgi:hypothetical protein